jgi:hypothetical protein
VNRADIAAYDRVVARNNQRAHDRLQEHNALVYAKQQDARGLEVIAAALAAARTAGGGVAHIDEWADRAWQLALDMFGQFGA